jgi:uncharacterized protein
MILVLLIAAALGHAIVWVALVNRLHGVGIHRRVVDVLTALCGLVVTLLPVVVSWTLFEIWKSDGTLVSAAPRGFLEYAASAYVVFCAAVFAVAAVQRLWLELHAERRGVMLANHTTRLEIKGGADLLAAPGLPALLSRLPGNQLFDVQLHEKQLVIPRLAAAHDGLRIAHLTDLHMSGRITKSYFEQVVEHVNASKPDIIAITGDIIEREKCIDWIPDTLGRLCAPAGVYFVLGNHDRRVGQVRLRAALAEAGLIHVGGRALSINVQSEQLLLAGNELPWFGPAPHVPCAPSDESTHTTRVLLAHTPDQFAWAKEHDFDLILAGHNHGGQVCVPLVGAILVPSLHGTRYAAGTFAERNTVLHVSRGTASLSPLRYNCPPEIAILVLRQKT